MRTLIYTSVKDQFKGAELAMTLRGGKDTAGVRVYEFWEGETEPCNKVITDHEGVAKAYKLAGVAVEAFTKIEKHVVDAVEEPVEELKPRRGRRSAE